MALKAILIYIMQKISKLANLKKHLPAIAAFAIGFFVLNYLTKPTPPIAEKPAQAEIIDKQTVVAEKTIVAEIKQNNKLKAAKSLQNSKPTRQINIEQTTKSGDEVNTSIDIYKDEKTGQTRAAVTTDNGEIKKVEDIVLDTTLPAEIKKDTRIYAELRTDARDAYAAIGFEKRITKHAYWGIELEKSYRQNDTKVKAKIGIDF